MNSNLLKMKERLDALLATLPLNSEEVLVLSSEIDCLIAEYYRNIFKNRNDCLKNSMFKK